MGGVVDTVKDIVALPVTIVTVSLEGIGKGLEFVGGDIVDDALGLDSLGNEIERWGTDIQQIAGVLSGDYHDRAKELEAYKNQVDSRITSYNNSMDELVDKMSSLIAFHEIFQMAAANRISTLEGTEGAALEEAIEVYNKMLADLRSDYDFVIGLTEGSFVEKIVGSTIMIIGGLMSDMSDILTGKADSATWKSVASTIIQLIVIVVLFVYGGPVGQTIAVIMMANLMITLDTAYANGAMTSAVFSVFDFLFNDVLKLDERIGADFAKFDSDHDDYEDIVTYTQLGLTLTTMYLAWTNPQAMANAFAQAGNLGKEAATSVQYGTKMGSQQTAMLAAQDAGMNGSFLGTTFSTYSDIYKAYSIAIQAKDIVSANKQYEDLKSKLLEDRQSIDDALNSKYRKNFMKHYKDTAYFLQDQQEYIDRYLWGMTAQNMYVDPYGTTPVANIRFTPDEDTRMMAFGYEDIFDDSKMAGSDGYFKSILYG